MEARRVSLVRRRISARSVIRRICSGRVVLRIPIVDPLCYYQTSVGRVVLGDF
jgi:hypothetical protein